jgi:hypothetical protein
MDIQDKTNDDIYIIKKHKYETNQMFMKRKDIYDRVYKDTNDLKKAFVYSNAIINKLTLRCEYEKEFNSLLESYIS